jgi:hypothetical protein
MSKNEMVFSSSSNQEQNELRGIRRHVVRRLAHQKENEGRASGSLVIGRPLTQKVAIM